MSCTLSHTYIRNHSLNLPDPLTGAPLEEAINSPFVRRNAYAEGLLYEKTAIMISADPGTGKSILSLQLAVQLSSGLPLFGTLLVPHQLKVYYIQKERPQLEVMERLKTFKESIEINHSNLIIDSSLQTINLSQLKYRDDICNRILKHNPSLIIIDPIGAGLGGLSKDEIANDFCSMLTFIQQRIGNAYWLSHHTTKQQYAPDGTKVDKEKPFYGSQWLDAFVTGHYHITKTSEGSNWRKTKDNYGVLLNKFSLDYEGDTNLSYLKLDNMTAKDKVLNYINSIRSYKKTFKFSELSLATGCVTDTLRHTLRDPIFNEVLERDKSIGEATLYKIKD